MMSRADGAWATRRRPGALIVVLALHGLLVLALWQTLRSRSVEVPIERHALLWVDALAPAQPRPAATVPTRREAPPPPRDRAAVNALPPPHESTWVVESTPAPAASAASAPPAERLLDSAASRAAIRQSGRLPLLHERVAQAAGETIERTDTGLAREVAEAGQPDCLKDGKAAAGQIGPIGLGGILGLPFLAARVATGRCTK